MIIDQSLVLVGLAVKPILDPFSFLDIDKKIFSQWGKRITVED
jgi:hypothetical protein